MKNLVQQLASRPVIVTGVIAFCIRILALWQLPIILSNDSADYVRWAQQLVQGAWPAFPDFRTPGYSMFLAALFAIGESPLLVQAANHLMGVCMVVAATMVIAKHGRPRIAILIGLLLAFDPRILAFETRLLSDTLTLTLVVGAAAMALLPEQPAQRRVIVVAVLLAAGCFVRPATQILVPFFLAAAALGPGWTPTIRRFILGSVLVALLLSPWAIYNANRGVIGLSGSKSVYMWFGVAKKNLLDPASMPDSVREQYEAVVDGHPEDVPRLHEFFRSQRVWHDRKVQKDLGAWANTSIRKQPVAYGLAVGRALLWQVDTYPWGEFQETAWYVKAHRLWRNESPVFDDNLLTHNSSHLEPFRITRKPGILAELLAQWSQFRLAGSVTLAFFVVAAWAVLIGVRRDPRPALLLLGCVAMVAIHAIYLSPYSRYSMSTWPVIAILAVPRPKPAVSAGKEPRLGCH